MGIFASDHMKKLLHNKFVLIMGDSVQRSIYKDFLVLWHEDRFMKKKELKAKGEDSFLGDKLVDRSELTNGIHYREVRQFKTDHFLIRFYFVTRIYNDYVESILKQYENDNEPTPDVVLLNSCLWDISRYGKTGWNDYQKNIEKFCSRLDDIIPAETCVIWRTTLPVSQGARGGFITSDIAKHTNTLLVDVLLANYLAHAVVTKHKYDVIDMHYMFTEQQQRRAKDGVHWNMFAHRRMTNIVLSHISEAWGLGLPPNPMFDDSKANFNETDVSMNTTDVLRYAYPSTSTAVRQPTSAEERYGGPIRSSEEMYQRYTDFYRVPLLSNPIYDNEENRQLVKFKLNTNFNCDRRVEFTEKYAQANNCNPSYPVRQVRAVALAESTGYSFMHSNLLDWKNQYQDYGNYPLGYGPQHRVVTNARRRKKHAFKPYPLAR